jgi:hypothetical protein
MSGRWALAIDFGTSNTVAAILADGGRPEELRFRLEPRLQSAVFLAPDGRMAVGRDAALQKSSAADRYLETPKRQVGKGAVVLGGQPVPDLDLVAAVVRAVIDEAPAGRRSSVGGLPHPPGRLAGGAVARAGGGLPPSAGGGHAPRPGAPAARARAGGCRHVPR